MYKPSFSYKDWLRFGYNGVPFSERTSQEDNWFLQLNRPSHKNINIKNSAVEAAKLLNERHGDNLCLFYSGGIDSEFMLHAFMEANVPFTLACLKYKNELNDHDLAYVRKFCDKHSLDIKFHELDIIEFFEGKCAYEYAEVSHCLQPELLPTMWLMDQVTGVPVLASGEPYLRKGDPQTGEMVERAEEDGEWFLLEREKIFSWHRFCQHRKIHACPAFFQYTPDLYFSYLNDPVFAELTNDRIPGKRSSMSSRHKIYSRFYDIEEREKFTGFEQVKPLLHNHEIQLQQKFGMYNDFVSFNVENLMF